VKLLVASVFFFFQVTANASQWRLENDSANQAVITDVSNLSTQAQWKLLKKESPELKELIKDFKVRRCLDCFVNAMMKCYGCSCFRFFIWLSCTLSIEAVFSFL